MEMEIYGAYTAAAAAVGRKPEFIAIKSVADFADSFKDSKCQRLASELSALVFIDLISNFPEFS